MDAFSYLSVLLSIVLGLAITQILQGFRGLLLARGTVVTYWPCIAWGFLLLVIDVQSWWAMFGLRTHVEWSFLAFAVVLAQTVLLYMLAALAFPDIGPERPVDLYEHYQAHSRWFFGIAVATGTVSIAKDVVLDGRLPETFNLGFQLFFMTTCAIAIVVRRDGYHKFIALSTTVGMIVYITVLFAHLR